MRHHKRILNYLVRSHHDTKIRVRDTNHNVVVFFFFSPFNSARQWFLSVGRCRCRCGRHTQLGFVGFFLAMSKLVPINTCVYTAAKAAASISIPADKYTTIFN